MPSPPAADGRASPRARRSPRRWTRRRRTLFLEYLAESCNVSAAARAAGVDRNSAYDLKDRDPAFAQGWRTALERAHSELALRLLGASKDGCVRTEMTVDGKTGAMTAIKLVHSYPLTVALRLFQSHQAEVEAFRLVGAQLQDDAAIGARVLAEMDLVRARLIGAGATSDDDG